MHQNQIKRMEEILQEDFNVSFKLIHKKSGSKNSKDVNFDYEIKKGEKSLRLKDLSEGERQIIALAFFFAQIEETASKQGKILIFDDPVTSMDARNLKLLVDLISKKTAGFSQVFIFTHHRLFYKFISKKYNSSAKNFGIVKNNFPRNIEQSIIYENKRRSKPTEELEKLGENIYNSATNNSLNMEEFLYQNGRNLRIAVEEFVKQELLGWQYQRFENIVAVAKNKQAKLLDSDYNTLEKIYEFCNHSNTSHYDKEETVSLEELKVQIEKFLEIYNKFHPLKTVRSSSQNSWKQKTEFS